MKVAIITEGFNGTGYGHLTRCLSIYQAFEEKNITPIYIANCDEDGKKFIPDVNLFQLNWLENDIKLLNFIKDFDIVVIDSYLASLKLYNKINQFVKKTVYIDDYIRLDYPSGIIVNGTIGAENMPYNKNVEHKYLLGIDYMPLRKEFWDVEVSNRNNKVNKVLLNFGAQDTRKLTPKILTFLLKHFNNYNYYIVGGKLADGSIKKENVQYYETVNARQMLELMLKSDIAISAAGQTTYELARLGLQTIAIGVSENQKLNLKGWKDIGFINEEIWLNDNNIFEKIERNILKMENVKIRVTVDGQGARRLINFCI